MVTPKGTSNKSIIVSVMQVRFESEISEGETLSIFYPLFSSDFPKVESMGGIYPLEVLESNPSLKFSTEHKFSNEKFSVSVGRNSISIENIDGYHSWENYFPVIKKSLTSVSSISKLKALTRIGIRYVNIFEDGKGIAECLNVNKVVDFDGYAEDTQMLRTDLRKKDYRFHIQILKKVKTNNKEGLYIDIDASMENNLPTKIDDTFFNILDTLHTEIKEILFNKLMKKEFMNTLNPTY